MAKGYALDLDLGNISEDEFVSVVEEVLSNSSYTEGAERYSKLFRDRPMTPKQSVLYWIEYVMRNKDVNHLQVGSQILLNYCV